MKLMYRPGDKLKLRVAPDPILAEVCSDVTVFDSALESLGKEMLRSLKKFNGVGLAASQVGFPVRLFVVGFGGGLIFVNPSLEVLDWSEVSVQEGCLSVPGERRKISRAKRVRVTAQNTSGQSVSLEAEGLDAIILQHEYDHLDGVLLTDRDPV